MLIDACYDREVFPTIEQAIDWCWASTNEEIEAVRFVISKFFTEHDGIFKQNTISEDLAKYHKNAKINKAIAVEREAKKRTENTKREQSVNDSTTNEHLITNYELGTTNHKLPIKDQELLPGNIKDSMTVDFRLNDTNMNWLDDSNLTGFDKSEIIKDFIDYWILDESKRTAKGWQQSFRKNPIVKRRIVNSKHNGANNGSYKQTYKPSLSERLEANRKRAIEQLEK